QEILIVKRWNAPAILLLYKSSKKNHRETLLLPAEPWQFLSYVHALKPKIPISVDPANITRYPMIASIFTTSFFPPR
ncbi:MAG: hypothetical protein ACK4G3_05210, partial [bacterium]